MKKSHGFAILAGGLMVACMAVSAMAQGTAGRTAGVRGPDIALIDIGKLYKDNPRFKQHMEDLQGRMQQAENVFKDEREKLRSLAEQLKDHQAGSPNYVDLERQIAKKKSDLTVAVELQRKEFLKDEAKIHYMIYQQIWDAVDEYARANGIVAVLKFNSDKADVEKPEDILRDLQKPVMWYHAALDITPAIQQMILSRLARGNGPATSPFQRNTNR